MKPRLAAVRVITQVLGQGRSLSAALPDILERVPQSKDRAFAQQLCFGVLRFLPRLEASAACHLDRPLKARDRDVYTALLLGLYQLIYLRTPDHAAVSETVALARAIGKPWAGRLINAVLRGFLRNKNKTLARIDEDEAVASAHPRWLFDMFRADWPEQWPAIIRANNEQPPMTLRVNQRRVDRATWLQRLRSAGMDAIELADSSTGLILSHPVDVDILPGFDKGDVSVQDGAAQLAATLLDVQPGDRVLDSCAAPGGKTAHLLELQPELASLVAIDIDGDRMQRTRQNLFRLGLDARLQTGDSGEPGQWWDGELFDRILLDAPCSASGVIRRHPDIKLLRHVADITALVVKQQHLLESMWSLLKPGGMLLYVTCSILKQENEQQITDFFDKYPDAREVSLHGSWGRAMQAGRQILPGENQMDGFYYACLQKTE